MEVVEDDVFFADLSKRISLLIMDDDEHHPVVHCPSVSFQAFSRAIHPNTQLPVLYEQNSRRESKGTGVFIPRSAHPRRKNRQGRFSNSSNSNFQRHSDESRGLPHHVPHNINTSYTSSNPNNRC